MRLTAGNLILLGLVGLGVYAAVRKAMAAQAAPAGAPALAVPALRPSIVDWTTAPDTGAPANYGPP